MGRECDSRKAAVNILKQSKQLDANTANVLTYGLVQGVLEAERQRMGLLEAWGWLDGDSKGPGQITQRAHTDVKKTFGPELTAFLQDMNQCAKDRGDSTELSTGAWDADVTNETLASFFVAAYLAIKIKGAQKGGRLKEDQLRYGLAIYHGGFNSIQSAQRKVDADAFNNNANIPFDKIVEHAKTAGDATLTEVIGYVEHVLSVERKNQGN